MSLYHFVSVSGQLLAQVGMIHDAKAGVSQSGCFVLNQAIFLVFEFRNGIGDKTCHDNGDAATHGYKYLVLDSCCHTDGCYGQTGVANVLRV